MLTCGRSSYCTPLTARRWCSAIRLLVVWIALLTECLSAPIQLLAQKPLSKQTQTIRMPQCNNASRWEIPPPVIYCRPRRVHQPPETAILQYYPCNTPSPAEVLPPWAVDLTNALSLRTQIEDLRIETEVDCIDWQTIRRGRKQRHIARPHGTGS